MIPNALSGDRFGWGAVRPVSKRRWRYADVMAILDERGMIFRPSRLVLTKG